ncbi:MAG: FkbM family methyltransferase [Anaerolineaceae bacterium]
MKFSFRELFPDTPEIHIVDVGASPIEGIPVYQPVLDQGGFRLTGFEPNPAMYEALLKNLHPHMTFLPYALGDGKQATLNICSAPGMTSIFEPDLALLGNFHGFSEWSQVIERQPLMTRRLDDIAEVSEIDFMKLDVQGSELAVLESAKKKLRHILVIHVETLFIPFYKDQPLFGDIDCFLRKAGFLFHKFGKMESRIFKPLLLDNDIYRGLSQQLWSDAVYVRPFTGFADLTAGELLKIARIMHDVYDSVDLAQLALTFYDRKTNSQRQPEYLSKLIPG